MTLDDLGNLGDLIGGVGVIVTLIYLALQIRQNTRALRTSFYAQASDPVWNLGALLTETKGMARVFRVGAQDPARLDEDEKTQFNVLLNMFFLTYENLYRLVERGLIDEDSFEHNIENVLPFLGSAGVRPFWGIRTGHWSERFQAYLRRRLDQPEEHAA
jgi:hypothetical protein